VDSLESQDGQHRTTLAQALMRNKVMSRYDHAISACQHGYFWYEPVGLDGSFCIGMQCGGAFSSLPTQRRSLWRRLPFR